jgi:hypothetical protein
VANLYLDHDVSIHLEPILESNGHHALTALEAGLGSGDDDEQILLAATQRRVLLTHNRKDYVLLHNTWRRWPESWGVSAPPHPGILVLDHAPVPDIATAVEAFLTRYPAVPLVNALYWWRRHSGWHHRLPDRR